jgi:tellurite resistance protein TerC
MSSGVAFGGLAAMTVVLLLVDLRLFARGRDPELREGVIWSIGWLVLSVLVALPLLLLDSGEDAVTYLTVYFIERSLSLDNLFVFLLLFSYFGVPAPYRGTLLFWGIVAALVLRGLAIIGGVAILKEFHFVIYVLGVLLLLLAYRILRGVGENVDPDNNFIVKLVRRFFPVTDRFYEGHWFVKLEGKRYATPLFLCLASIVAADIAFAVDSIPAAFAITRESVLIWMANIFALLGLRALFVIVEELIRRFRYLDATIAIVLALVGVQLLIEDLYDTPPLLSLGLVALCFIAGIVASIVADRRDPDAEEKRRQRVAHASGGGAAAHADEPARETTPR